MKGFGKIVVGTSLIIKIPSVSDNLLLDPPASLITISKSSNKKLTNTIKRQNWLMGTLPSANMSLSKTLPMLPYQLPKSHLTMSICLGLPMRQEHKKSCLFSNDSFAEKT